jgi:trimethylamine:corrinoid methyltransferase-like protein
MIKSKCCELQVLLASNSRYIRQCGGGGGRARVRRRRSWVTVICALTPYQFNERAIISLRLHIRQQRSVAAAAGGGAGCEYIGTQV